MILSSAIAPGSTVIPHGSLNERALRRCQTLTDLRAAELRVTSQVRAAGTTIYDFGVHAEGSLEAGLLLAEVCVSGLARIELTPTAVYPHHGAAVTIRTDHPVAACMASQYAGWQISEGKFHAMGSGPMRVAACQEPLLQELQYREQTGHPVGVLEAAELPPDQVCQNIASACGAEPAGLTLCVAPTASIAGTVQVVARSVETALHKMHELGFDLQRVVSGFGTAPLPPVAAEDLVGIGRTNDAVLYGGQVTLWVRDSDEQLHDLAPRIPSQASRDYGVPFLDVFQRYNGNFYEIDPHLFSPACICLVNLTTGRSFSAGELREDLLERSFT